MDNRFLNKVVNQIVSETEIDYGRKVIETPFTSSPRSFLYFSLLKFSFLYLFINHCKEVYGLNEEETDYVWNEYKEIIISKINQ